MSDNKSDVTQIDLAKELLKKHRSKTSQELLEKFSEKLHGQVPAPKYRVEKADNKASLKLQDGDNPEAVIALLSAYGTTSSDFSNYISNELLNAATRGNLNSRAFEGEANGILAALHSLSPQDEIEGMLASQMIATHFASMRVLSNLKGCDTLMQYQAHGNIATKLMRTFTAQMEALNRYRGKGEQKILVQHVNVENGGQAIVGNVNHSKGGGVQSKTEEQPHAKQNEDAPMQEMPSENPQGEPVPIPSHA